MATTFRNMGYGSKGWERMWAALAERWGGDTVAECPETGEVWQYMGSYSDNGKTWNHEFRHRSLKGQRVSDRIKALDSDFEPGTCAEGDVR